MVPTPNPNADFWGLQLQERRRLKSASLYVGFCMLAILIVSYAVGILAGGQVYTLEEQYLTSGNQRYYYLYQLAWGLVYCLYMAVPVPVISLLMRRLPVSSQKPRPIGGTATVMLIFVGMAVCVFANLATGYYVLFLEWIGFPVSTQPELTLGPGWTGWLAQMITIALLPGIFEELVFRGYLLQALRPFGDRMAIFWSALLFGFLHGNMEQMPFAFMLGLIFGFIAVKTGRLWIGMVIHFLNNGLSVTIQYLPKGLFGITIPDDNFSILYAFAGLALIGLFCGGVLMASRHRVLTTVTDTQSVLTKSQRVGALLLSPTVLISLILMTLIAVLETLAAAVTYSI